MNTITKKEENDFYGWNEINKLKKEKSRNKNTEKFNQLFINISIIKEFNNITEFKYKDNIYYFYQVTGIIRRKGNNLRYRLDNFFNSKENTIQFGKYKGKTINELSILDLNYLKWMKKLKTINQNMLNEINQYV